jgi:dienelactone hydrolase
MSHRRVYTWILPAAIVLSLTQTSVIATEAYSFKTIDAPSPYAIAWLDHSWHDAVRNRNVPARIYYPTNGSEKESFPLIVFSTGLGRSRDDCAYLGRHWARCGYVAVHVQHIGSDEAARQGTLRPLKELQKAFYSQQNIQNRPMDIIFVIHQIEAMQREGATPAKQCDVMRIGVAGHDFGAQTVLGLVGQVLPGQIAFDEPRVKAVLAMSSPVPLGQVPLELAYSGITRPCMHITGTADNSIVGTTQASQRRLPFDYTSGADQFLLTFRGVDHMTYSGHLRASNGSNDGWFHRQFAECSAVFWDAYLKENVGAKAWLTEGQLQKQLQGVARVEKKLASNVKPVETAKVDKTK